MSERRKVLELFEEQKEFMEERINYGIEMHRKGYAKLVVKDGEGNPVPEEIFYELYHIYLDPLRDYGRFLRPGRNNILGKFFSFFLM